MPKPAISRGAAAEQPFVASCSRPSADLRRHDPSTRFRLNPDIEDSRNLGPLSDSKPTLACQLRSSLRMSPLKCALESAEGDQPMSLVRQLETPLPARLFQEFSVLPEM